MKTLGLIGGTTWLSTVEYYRMINQQVNERLGGLHSARLILYSVNFEEFQPPTDPKAWGPITENLTSIAQRLERAGADCLVLCANTPHIAADTIQGKIRIPLIHIAEATAREIAGRKLKTVGLLGTRITMEQAFYRDKLSKAGIACIIPGDNERNFIHATIFDELGKEIFKPETKKHYLDIIDDLTRKGAEGIIFGCTEIPLLIKQKDCIIPVFDTTIIHATAAVDFALAD
jgi:aspartate racemase